MASQQQSRQYREEVLGRKVEIRFQVDEDNSNTKFYAGTICEMNCLWNVQSKAVDTTHFVKFEDGDEHWFDLQEQEEEGNLRWPSASTSTTASTNVVTPNVKRESNVKVEVACQNHPAISPRTLMKTEEEETSEEEGSVDKKFAGEEEAQELSDRDDSSDGDTTLPVPEVMPSSISDVCRYIDKHIDNGFYERQQDNRGECSSTRAKLRNFAKKNPTDLAIRHWKETGNWQPPTEEAFFALVEKVQEVCNKKRKRS